MSIRRILHLIVALSLALGWLAAPAQTAAAMGLVDEPLLWVPNDVVQTMAIAGDTLYIGGDFTRIGPPTGPFADLDPVTSWRPPDAAGRCRARAFRKASNTARRRALSCAAGKK